MVSSYLIVTSCKKVWKKKTIPQVSCTSCHYYVRSSSTPTPTYVCSPSTPTPTHHSVGRNSCHRGISRMNIAIYKRVQTLFLAFMICLTLYYHLNMAECFVSLWCLQLCNYTRVHGLLLVLRLFWIKQGSNRGFLQPRLTPLLSF